MLLNFYWRKCNMIHINHQDFPTGWTRISRPSPPTELSHMLLSPTLTTVCVASVVGNLCVCVCVCPDTGPFCSPAGQLIRSYSNNQLCFTALSFSLLIHFVWPPSTTTSATTTSAPSHQYGWYGPAWKQSARLSPSILTERSNSGSLSPVLTLISIHRYASGVSGTVIPIMILESQTSS